MDAAAVLHGKGKPLSSSYAKLCCSRQSTGHSFLAMEMNYLKKPVLLGGIKAIAQSDEWKHQNETGLYPALQDTGQLWEDGAMKWDLKCSPCCSTLWDSCPGRRVLVLLGATGHNSLGTGSGLIQRI